MVMHPGMESQNAKSRKFIVVFGGPFLPDQSLGLRVRLAPPLRRAERAQCGMAFDYINLINGSSEKSDPQHGPQNTRTPIKPPERYP